MTLWFNDTRVRILVVSERCSLVESEARAGNMPPLHVHHDEDETFYVLAGKLSLHTLEGTVELGPGDAALGPRGIPHTYRVESETARWLVATNGGGFADFVAATSVPAADGGYAPPEWMAAPEVLGAEAAARGIEILGPPGLLPQQFERVS